MVTATTADPSVTNPGKITFTTATTPGVTFQNNEDCSVAEGGSAAECDLFGDDKLLLTVTIGTDAPTGPLLIAGTELGQPALNVTGDLQIVARPAALDLVNPQITQQPVAGGTGAFTVTVTNTGGQPSAEGELLTIDLPVDFTPQQITVNGEICWSGNDAARVAVDCALPAIEPGEDALITVGFLVAPGTTGGTATVSVSNAVPVFIDLTVKPGIIGLAGQAQGPLVADGQAHNIVITATTADPSVTNPGKITFTTATTPGVTFQNNEDCSVAEGGTPRNATCSATTNSC